MKYSHLMYDDITDLLFLYFEDTTVQNLSAPSTYTNDIHEYEEMCIHINPKEIPKLLNDIQNDTLLQERLENEKN